MSNVENTVHSLQHYEEVIDKGLQTFIDVGEALIKIKEKKLYKVNYSNFGDYCKERWGFSQQHAGRLIKGSDIVNKIKSEPDGSSLPQSENQTRALSMSKDPALDWKKAQEISGQEQPSANTIKDVVSGKHADHNHNTIDDKVDSTVDEPKDTFWATFSKLLEHPYEFGDTSGRKQIAINTDNDSVERLEKLRSMTGYTKGEIVSQALCLMEEMMIEQTREISSQK